MYGNVPFKVVWVLAVACRAIPKSMILTEPSIQNEDVAGLDVAMDEAHIVGGMQSASSLIDDVDGAFDGQAGAVVFDELLQCGAGQQAAS